MNSSVHIAAMQPQNGSKKSWTSGREQTSFYVLPSQRMAIMSILSGRGQEKPSGRIFLQRIGPKCVRLLSTRENTFGSIFIAISMLCSFKEILTEQVFPKVQAMRIFYHSSPKIFSFLKYGQNWENRPKHYKNYFDAIVFVLPMKT